jgi:hypothetical protein
MRWARYWFHVTSEPQNNVYNAQEAWDVHKSVWHMKYTQEPFRCKFKVIPIPVSILNAIFKLYFSSLNASQGLQGI